MTISVSEAPFDPLAVTERFMELRQFQLDKIPADCTHGVIWDDDHLLEDPGELIAAVDDGADLTYIKKIFFWDTPYQIATHFPEHNSVFVFKRLPGDNYDMSRMLHAPQRVHDAPDKVVQLNGRLLDYGYMDPVDRQRCWDDYKRVGKIDAATLPLISTPTLEPWAGVNPFESAWQSQETTQQA